MDVPFANLLLKFIAIADILMAITVSAMMPTTIDIAVVTGAVGLLVVLIGDGAMLTDGNPVMVDCIDGIVSVGVPATI